MIVLRTVAGVCRKQDGDPGAPRREFIPRASTVPKSVALAARSQVMRIARDAAVAAQDGDWPYPNDCIENITSLLYSFLQDKF